MTVFIYCNRHVVDAEIPVVENETIERGLVAVSRHDLWNEAQERLLGYRSKWDRRWYYHPPTHVAYVPDRRFDLGRTRERDENVAETILRNAWKEARWKVKIEAAVMGAEWTPMEKVFKE